MFANMMLEMNAGGENQLPTPDAESAMSDGEAPNPDHVEEPSPLNCHNAHCDRIKHILTNEIRALNLVYLEKEDEVTRLNTRIRDLESKLNRRGKHTERVR
jgi:hypothetical protein